VSEEAVDATGVAIARALDFAVELDKLKAVLRRTRPVGLDRQENSAEHSWQLAVVAMTLAAHAAETVDVGRVLEMLLVHDIPEIDCGDHFVYSRDPAATARVEAAAAKRLFGLLPEEIGARLHARWHEFEEQRTPEARFAHAIDRMLPILQNLRGGAYSWREHGITADQVKAINGAAIERALPAVWRVLEPKIDALFASGAMDPDASAGGTR
jgi:putative hydrolases of HD superfamily